MAGKKHPEKGKKGKKTTYTFKVKVTTSDLAGTKKNLSKVGRVIDAPSKAVAGGIKKLASAVKSDVARGKESRDRKMKATGSRADASAKLAERKAAQAKAKKQKSRVSAIAAGKRKRSGKWQRGAGGG